MQNYMQDILDKWEESGISIGEMARRADLGESTVRRLKGGGNATYGTLLRVAEVLGIEDAPQSSSTTDMYELLLAEQRRAHEREVKLYERAIASGKKRELVKTIAIIILSIILAIYFLYFDVRNGGWGFVQYSSSRYSDSAPNGTSL